MHKNNREMVKRYFQKKPWAKYICYIMSRCGDKNRRYYKRGIKCYLTIVDLETFWFRDKAYLMKRPSIDRIDSSKNYTSDNCRFIELDKNIRGTMFKKGRIPWNKPSATPTQPAGKGEGA